MSADDTNSWKPGSPGECARALRRLVSELTDRVTDLYLWCAGVYHAAIPPELQEEVLTTPLRSAPSVIRAVQPALDMWSRAIRGYSDSGLPAPGDGPSVIELDHRGYGHRGWYPVECDLCGRNVAATLRSIGVGAGGGGHTNALQYRDVMVIAPDDSGLQDEVRDDAGRVTSPASGVVRGLRGAGVPVCVLEGSDRVGGSGNDNASDSGSGMTSGSDRVVDRAGWERRVADVAVSRTDRVTVSAWECVQGLERRVVVWLADWGRKGVEAMVLDRYNALPGTSRCTTQLIVVYPPDPYTPTPTAATAPTSPTPRTPPTAATAPTSPTPTPRTPPTTKTSRRKTFKTTVCRTS